MDVGSTRNFGRDLVLVLARALEEQARAARFCSPFA